MAPSHPHPKAMVSRNPDDIPPSPKPGHLNGGFDPHGSPDSGSHPAPPHKKRITVRVPVFIDVTMDGAEDDLEAEVFAQEKVAGLQVSVPPEFGFTVKIVGLIHAAVVTPK